MIVPSSSCVVPNEPSRLHVLQAYGLANPTVFATEAVQTMMGLTEGEYKGKIVIILGENRNALPRSPSLSSCYSTPSSVPFRSGIQG